MTECDSCGEWIKGGPGYMVPSMGEVCADCYEVWEDQRLQDYEENN